MNTCIHLDQPKTMIISVIRKRGTIKRQITTEMTSLYVCFHCKAQAYLNIMMQTKKTVYKISNRIQTAPKMGNHRSKTLNLAENRNDNRSNAGRYTVVRSLSEAQCSKTPALSQSQQSQNITPKENTRTSSEFHNIQLLPCYVSSNEEQVYLGTSQEIVRPEVARYTRYFGGSNNNTKNDSHKEQMPRMCTQKLNPINE